MHIHATLKCHTLVYAGFTHARDAAAAAARCTIMRSREEKEGERKRSIVRERKRRKQWDVETWEKRAREIANTGRCTWKLCGAVKPRHLLFTICRDHTKFIRRDHTTPIDTWGRPLFRVRASPYPNYPHVASDGIAPAVLIADHCGPREKESWPLSCVLDNEIRRKLWHNRYGKLTLRQLPRICTRPYAPARPCGILRQNRTSGLKHRWGTRRYSRNGGRSTGKLVVVSRLNCQSFASFRVSVNTFARMGVMRENSERASILEHVSCIKARTINAIFIKVIEWIFYYILYTSHVNMWEGGSIYTHIRLLNKICKVWNSDSEM